MATKPRVERPAQTIKSNTIPLSVTLKEKISLAFTEVVSKIKEKHLS
jgi:hypothetical protein